MEVIEVVEKLLGHWKPNEHGNWILHGSSMNVCTNPEYDCDYEWGSSLHGWRWGKIVSKTIVAMPAPAACELSNGNVFVARYSGEPRVIVLRTEYYECECQKYSIKDHNTLTVPSNFPKSLKQRQMLNIH